MIQKDSNDEKKKKILENETTEKFVRKEQYNTLNELIKKIPSICKEIEDGLKYEMKLYQDKITKDPTEFVVQIGKIKTKINEINVKVSRKADKIREKYTDIPKGIIIFGNVKKNIVIKGI